MQELTVNVEGETISDLVAALEEVIENLEAGFTSGLNGNDDVSYNFSLTNSD